MKVICCQTDIVWEDKRANFERVAALLEKAAVPADSMIVLPEMFATGFSMNVAGIYEEPSGGTAKFLAGLAQKHKALVVGGMVTRGPEGKGRNEAAVFHPSGVLLARYAKLQPFSLGGEMQHYAPGAELVTFPWGPFTVAPFVCYDLRFPELFREAARRGAQMFVVIANWPVARTHHWVGLLQARAIENQAYVAGVNRCGDDPKFKYPGRTIVVDPHGHIVADAGDRECVISADVDVKKVLEWRMDFPALRDMRADFAAGKK